MFSLLQQKSNKYKTFDLEGHCHWSQDQHGLLENLVQQVLYKDNLKTGKCIVIVSAGQLQQQR
jgi:hypothetical protein